MTKEQHIIQLLAQQRNHALNALAELQAELVLMREGYEAQITALTADKSAEHDTAD